MAGTPEALTSAPEHGSFLAEGTVSGGPTLPFLPLAPRIPLVFNQREHIMPLQLLSSFEKGELHQKGYSGDMST